MDGIVGGAAVYHDVQHTNLNDAVSAIETYVGTTGALGSGLHGTLANWSGSVAVTGTTSGNALNGLFTINQSQPTNGGGSSIPVTLYVTSTAATTLNHSIGILSLTAPVASVSQTGQIWYAMEGRVDLNVEGIAYGVLGLASLDATNNTGSIVVGVQGRAEPSGSPDGNGLTVGGWMWGYGGLINYAALFGGSGNVGDQGLIGIRGASVSGNAYYEAQIEVLSNGGWLFNLKGAGTNLTAEIHKLADHSAGTYWAIVDDNSSGLFLVFSNGNATLSGVFTSGGTNTAGAAASVTPTTTSGGSAQQVSATQDSMVYLQVGTAGTAMTVSIGHTSSANDLNILTSAVATGGELISFRLPAAWYFKWAATTATLAHQTALTC